MRTYKSLLESLPTKTVVFAFGRFNPPTVGHSLLIKVVLKTAQHFHSDHVIFASRTKDTKKNPLTIERKLHYLKLGFPNVNFVGASDQIRTFIEAAKELNKKYKNLIMIAGSDRVTEFQEILNKYNGKEFNFDSIKVISAGERDPDSDSASGMSASKMRDAAVKGNFELFKKGAPELLRDIDIRRLMNDVREGMGLEAIKEQVKLPYNELREKYFQGAIYNIGDIVESISGNKFEIVKRGTNHLLVKNDKGIIESKWINEVFEVKND